MPSLQFVLPHWLYWGTLIVFPIAAWALVVRQRRSGAPTGPSLFIAYLFWFCAGFVGLHRFYLRSFWGLALSPGFPHHPLFQRPDQRCQRGCVAHALGSGVRAGRAKSRKIREAGANATPEAAARLSKAGASQAKAKADFEVMEAELDDRFHSSAGAGFRRPSWRHADLGCRDDPLRGGQGLRKQEAIEAGATRPAAVVVPDVPPIGTTKIRRSVCTPASPMRWSRLTGGPANSSPIGR